MKDKNTELIKCILCSDDNSDTIYKNNDVSVSICKNDGLVYLNPRWLKEEYALYYQQNYDLDYRKDHGQLNEMDKYKTAEQIWAKFREAEFHTPHSILDIGAGMGWILDFFKGKVGSDVARYAIESSESCKVSLDNLSIKLIASDVDSEWQQGITGKFDLIIMRHVVEHFLDPVKVLKKVKSVISNNGTVYIAVPDMMSPILPFDGYWFRPVHTYYFSKKTLLRCAALAGLEPVTLNSGNSEVSGFFKKANDISKTIFDSIYDEQMAVIRRKKNEEEPHNLRNILRRFWYFLRSYQ